MQGRKSLALLPLASAAALLAALAGNGAVRASGSIITVTGFGDGGGSCADATHCPTLRSAIAQAVSGDTIDLPAGTYTLSNLDVGALVVNKGLTISGAGASTTTITGVCNVEQSWSSRLFTIVTEGPASVVISGVTLTHGRATNTDDWNADGGAVLAGGASRVALNDDVVTGNEAVGNGGGVAVDTTGASLSTADTRVEHNLAGTGSDPCAPQDVAPPQLSQGSDGGGVYSDGVVTMVSSSVGNNAAGGNGGGLYLSPPEGGTDHLSLMYVHDNTAMATLEAAALGGGGIYEELVAGSHVVLDQSTLSHNHAANANGGGIYADFSFGEDVASRVTDAAPQMTITNTTFDANDAAVLGGATYLHGGVSAAMTNDTVYGNSAADGGAIALGDAAQSHLAMESLTVDGNHALAGLGGGLLVNDGAATIHNTIVALDDSVPLQVTVAAALHNCSLGRSVLTTLGYNMSDDTTCALTATGDQQPPKTVLALGPLQDNGGPTDGAAGDTSPTLTQSPTAGSTSLDQGDPNNFPPTDERGVSRPQQAPSGLLGVGSHVARVGARVLSTAKPDVGALEVKAAPVAPTPPPTSPVPSGGLQGVISVPSTGGGPDAGSPAVVTLLCVSLLTAAAGAAVAWRRR